MSAEPHAEFGIELTTEPSTEPFTEAGLESTNGGGGGGGDCGHSGSGDGTGGAAQLGLDGRECAVQNENPPSRVVGKTPFFFNNYPYEVPHHFIRYRHR